jgi:CheY-like chemotaxis protein
MSQTKSGGAPTTIFVVDDEPMLLELAAAILQPTGFNVRTFRDPQAALAEFSAANPPPAIVVTDYAMGVMTGLDLIRECRRIQPRQKILLLSGTVDESIYADTPVKPDRFLAKPYQAHDLITLIQSLAAA